MAIFENFTYTNLHELNLDWIIEQVKKWSDEVKELDIKFDNLDQAFVDLETYIDNYFTDLDVQEEINNKLDEMLENGQLEIIISQFLQSESIIVFNTLRDLKAGDNFVSGETIMKLGKYNYLDHLTSIYKVREIRNTDVVDNVNIIALNNYPSLVAELVINVGHNRKRYIFIGDSFNTTDTPEGGVPILPWSTPLSQYLGLSADQYFSVGRSGSGFVNPTTFLALLQTLESTITDPETITDILFYGGANDLSASSGDFYDAITAISNYVAGRYPNALITLGFNSWGKNYNSNVSKIQKMTYMFIQANKPNIRVIENSINFYHWYGGYQPDGHPTEQGSRQIAYNLANYFKYGETRPIGISNSTLDTTGNELDVTSLGNLTTVTAIQQDSIIDLSFSSTRATISLNNKTIIGEATYKLASFDTDGYAVCHSLVFHTYAWLYNGTYNPCTVQVIIDNNVIYLYFELVQSSGIQTLENVSVIRLDLPNHISLSSFVC